MVNMSKIRQHIMSSHKTDSYSVALLVFQTAAQTSQTSTVAVSDS